MSAVMQLYREAWRQDERETSRQRQRDVVVSILAPSAALWAMAHTFWMYWKEGDPHLHLVGFLILLGGVLSFRIFAYACRILIKKEAELEKDEKSQPVRNVTMLAFATWLFPMGLFFTIAEMYDDLWMPIGPLEFDCCTRKIGRSEFSSPWGDALLAFSAFCMLAEEFSLVDLYDDVKRKFGEAKEKFGEAEEEVKAIVSLGDDAKEKLNEIVDIRNDTKTLQRETRRYSTSIREMFIEMRRARNPFFVFLKWCSVVGGIILLLYVLIKLQKLEDAIKTPTSDSALGTISAPATGSTGSGTWPAPKRRPVRLSTSS